MTDEERRIKALELAVKVLTPQIPSQNPPTPEELIKMADEIKKFIIGW